MKANLDYGVIFQAKTLALIVGVGGGLILVGSQGLRWFQDWQVQRQEQALLTHVQALEASKDYGQCRSQGLAVEPTAGVYPEVISAVQSCYLTEAQGLADQGNWQGTLALLADFPSSFDRYGEAEALMSQGVAAVVQQAEERLADGDLAGAQALVQELPATTPGLEAVTRLTQQWQTEWDQNTELTEAAAALLKRGRWLETKQTLEKVSANPHWQTEIEPLMTKAQAGIDRVMARERAARRSTMAKRAAPQPQRSAQQPVATPVSAPQPSPFTQRLESVYDTYVDQGMAEWEAWQTACQTMGGTVVDQGPESTCQS